LTRIAEPLNKLASYQLFLSVLCPLVAACTLLLRARLESKNYPYMWGRDLGDTQASSSFDRTKLRFFLLRMDFHFSP
jgi:hypothetical protein